VVKPDRTGIDGPYQVPGVTAPQRVLEEWIDYNGHMNVAYYTLAFDIAVDGYLEEVLGIGPTFVSAAGQGPYALQAHYHYLRELHLGEAFFVRIYLADADAKRLHTVAEMVHAESGEVAAVQETVMMNVDLGTRRSTPYPDWAQARIRSLLEANRGVKLPQLTGQPIGLRRRPTHEYTT